MADELTKDSLKLKEFADQYGFRLNVAALVANFRKSVNFTQQEIAQKNFNSSSFFPFTTYKNLNLSECCSQHFKNRAAKNVSNKNLNTD